jgi:tRNA uracil 4-sulfurtransferase
MNDRIIIHYDEIALKGKNRRYFEEALARNIRTALGDLASGVQRLFGRIVCIPKVGADRSAILRRLERLPGIAHFSLGISAPRDMEAISRVALELASRESFSSFGVKASRSDKSFALTSEDIGAHVGAYVLSRLDRKVKVDLKNPEFRLFVELTHTEAFLYGQKIKGVGGLPTGTGGKILASLSGGIDSPVASWLMMKRGCEVVFVHIRNETQFTQGTVSKIEDLVRILNQTQLRSTLYMVPFGDLQRHIIAFVPAKYRMIIYRRMMMKILGHVAAKEGAKAIVTGDSLGQVASQTLENLACIQAASSLPVLSPLIGFNKEETVTLARRIGTLDASTVPYPDCCSFMIAAHPETRAHLDEMKRYEAGIENTDRLIEEALSQADIKRFGMVAGVGPSQPTDIPKN